MGGPNNNTLLTIRHIASFFFVNKIGKYLTINIYISFDSSFKSESNGMILIHNLSYRGNKNGNFNCYL